MYESKLEFCLGYRREIWDSLVSDYNLVKVLKEISKAWWNLFFYVVWIWFKELRGRWAIEVQIRDPLKKKKTVAENMYSL